MANVIFICDSCGEQSIKDELCPSCGIKMYRDNDEWRDNYRDADYDASSEFKEVDTD